MIPATLDSIGAMAFAGCSAMTYVTSLAEVPPALGPMAFYRIDSNCVLRIRYSTAEAYYADERWMGWFTHIQAYVK